MKSPINKKPKEITLVESKVKSPNNVVLVKQSQLLRWGNTMLGMLHYMKHESKQFTSIKRQLKKDGMLTKSGKLKLPN